MNCDDLDTFAQSDDLEDFLLLNGVLEHKPSSDHKSHNSNNNFGCGTLLILLLIFLALAYLL